MRRDILGGVLRPGARLSPHALAEQHGVSLGVVREALTRLGEQGLVVSQPQQGFQVVPLSRDDLLDLTSVRLDLETLALRRSVELGDVVWRSNVIAAHHILQRTPPWDPDRAGDPMAVNEDWARAHQHFHLLLLSACGSRRLLEIAEGLRDAAEVYRRWSTPIAGGKRDVDGEHRAILDAVAEGNVDVAVAALARHIAHTTDVLIDHAS